VLPATRGSAHWPRTAGTGWPACIHGSSSSSPKEASATGRPASDPLTDTVMGWPVRRLRGAGAVRLPEPAGLQRLPAPCWARFGVLDLFCGGGWLPGEVVVGEGAACGQGEGGDPQLRRCRRNRVRPARWFIDHVLAQPGWLGAEGAVSASRSARKRCSGSVCARSSARRYAWWASLCRPTRRRRSARVEWKYR
jgi:hypothetical protein